MLWSLLIVFPIALCNTHFFTPNGTTSQSSDYENFDSAWALDGNKRRCAHTKENHHPNSWWRIDLLAVYNVSSFRIYNVVHHNTNITGARIHIGNSRVNNGISNKMCHHITQFTRGTWNNFKCNTTMSGRYITVFLPSSEPLVLCEVMISGTKQDSPFLLVRENKTWEDALDYCRDKHMDLASVLNEDTQAWAELESRKANTPYVWLGLHYTCVLEFWFWVDDNRVDYTHWSAQDKLGDCDMSGAMETKEDHLWFSKFVLETFNFICAICDKSSSNVCLW